MPTEPDPLLSPSARLNPTSRLCLALAAVGLALAWSGPVALGIAAGSAVGAVLWGRARRLALALLALVPVTVSSLAVNAFFPAGGGLGAAVSALARLVAVTSALTLLFATTPAADLVADLEARGLGRRAAYVLGSALSAVPRARERAAAVVEAQRARGLDTEGSWWRRLRGIGPLVGPLVWGSLAEVEERALALEVRAFTAPGRRTLLRRYPDGRRQRALRWAAIAVLAAGLAARILVLSP
jgi:energy-coupling factor transporter transmembrane protein EcfT